MFPGLSPIQDLSRFAKRIYEQPLSFVHFDKNKKTAIHNSGSKYAQRSVYI